MEFVHVFEGGDEPVFVKERDLAEYRKRFSKSEESLAFDVDGKPVFVRARDVGAFKQKHGGKAEPAFGVDVDGEPVFMKERDRAAFAKKMGAAARAKAEAAPASGFDTPWQGFKEGALRGARDVAVNVAKGVASVPDVVVGTADLVTAPLQAGVSKLVHGEAQTGLIGAGVEMATEAIAPGLNRVGEKIDALHSEEYLADRAGVNEAEGFRATAAELVRNPHVVAGSVLESVTPMLMGGGIGNRLAKAAPWLKGVAGSIGEGLVAGGSLQEQFRAGRGSGTTTPVQSALAAGAGLATGLVGAASNRLGSLVGASDVEAVAAGVAKRGVKAATRAERALRGIAGTALEGFEEVGQTPGETIARNLGTGRPWDEGLKNEMVQGGVAGAAMGLGANVDLRRGPVAERVAAARREGTPDPLLEDSEAGKAARLAAMRANRPTPPPDAPPTMPQDGTAAPPPMIVEIDGKPHEVVAEDPAAQTATVVSEMGELKQVPLSMVPPKPENVVGAPPPEAPELGEVVPDADGTGQRATLVSAPMFLPPATAPEMIALPEPVPPVLPDAPPLDVPDVPPAMPPATVETPPRAETPEMPPATVETPPQAETPEIPPPVAAKEPWQMTKKDVEKAWSNAPKNSEEAKSKGWRVWKVDPSDSTLRYNLRTESPDGIQYVYDSNNGGGFHPEIGIHEISIIRAIAEGKPVPAEVLAEYPELAKQSQGEKAKKPITMMKQEPEALPTPATVETPEMPPPVAAGELPGAENVTRTKKTKAKGFEAPVVVEAPAETPDVSQPLEQARALYAEFEPDEDMSAMAQTIAGLIEAKDADGLRRWVMHGRGFNDTTKKVVFRMIGKPVPSNREAIGRAIDEWFGVSAEARAEIERGAEAARRAEVEARKEEKRQENEAEWKASVQGKDTDRAVSYLLEMPALRRGSAVSALNRLFRFDGVVRSRRAQVEHLIDGGAEVSTRTEPAVKPMTRTQYNRASNEQQEAHERRMREGGEKTVYLVGDYDIGKQAYDYALHLIAQREQSTAETPNPSKPADAVTAQGAQPPGSGTPGEVARQGADVAENAEGEGGGARFSPAEGEGGGVETGTRGAKAGGSVTPEQDAAYMAAVEAGDTATAQKMVDEAARKAGYNVGPVWHGTDSLFTVFYKNKQKVSGFWFSTDKEFAKEYGSPKSYFIKLKNPIDENSQDGARIIKQLVGEWRNAGGNELAFGDSKYSIELREIQEIAASNGYDGVVNDYKTAVFSPSQVKSADAVTRDDAGNVIPLSERFNPKKDDVRFSPAEGEGGGVETAARAPAPGVASVRRGTPQGVAGGKLNGKPRIGLRLGDVVEFAVALANGKVPRVVERIRGLGGRAAGVFKPNADGTASIDIRADQALVVGTGERAALMAETSEQVQAELGERPGVEDAEARAEWDARAREVFKEKLDEAFARNVQDDPEQAMKVMAHEVGHWVDWLPDNTLKRGNVFGHIAALKGFLFGKLGLTPDQQLTAAQIEGLRERALEEAGGDSKKARSIFAKLKSKAEAGSEMARLPEVKAELEKLIAWYNNSESMPEYYSEPAEMFADAFSAWLNYPAEVAARAPLFNSLVEEWIAARPEAYAHYAAIQKKLETPGMSEGEQVRKLEEGFERSRRDAELAARARERVGGAELSDRVLAFFHRTMDPIYRRVARLEDKARAAETLKALADQRYWGADAERITTQVGERVVKRLQAAGVSITRFNTFLAMRRIANEGVNTMVDEQRKRGRANLFNPFGFTARSAGAWLKAHGEKFPESLAAMETAAGELVAIRREVLFPILKASGAVSEATYEMLLENWAYAKFKVNQHGELKSALERMMGVGEGGSGLKTQRGTLREIGGPLENTVLADIAMARWALTQNANWRAIQDIMATTPEDVKELRPQWVAGKPVWRDVNTPRVKTVHVTRLGVDHAFAVPTAIARALGKRGDESVVSVLAARLVQGQARMLTTLNLGFALRNPFRDYQRAARLLPGWAYLPVIGNPQLLWRVFSNLPASVRRARGLADPRVDEALKRRMLVAGSGSYSTDSWYGAEDDVSKAVRNSGLGMRAAANKGLEAGRRALDLLGVVTKALQLSETAVKLASMQYLDAKFPAMPEHIKQRMVQRYGGTPDVLERSMLGSSPAARMALLFYNINKEGLVNAVEVARERPIEQAYKAAVGAMPAIATSMAAYGVFSSMLRELAGAFDDDDEDDDEAQEAKHGLALWAEQVADWETMQKSVPFRDRMLYNATAFAWTDKEQGKVAYVRFMDDPMNGAVRAMTLGALEAAQGRVSVFDALDIGVGDQTPNLSPFASLGVALLTGKDAAFGWRNIVSDPRAINSPEGRKQNLKEYAKWTYNNISGGTLGLYRIQPDRDPAAPPPGALEEKLKTAGLGTLASSFVRVSNAGLREQFRKQDAQYEGWQYDNTKLADRWLEMKEAREDIPEEMQKRRREIPPARWEQMLTERRNERNLKSKPLDVQRRKETRNRPRDFR